MASGKPSSAALGCPFQESSFRLAEDGEILLRGKNVFMGYYKEEAATSQALVDGWLCSGDLGAFDEDGFMNLTGRKKEIIITAGGKNIAPKNLEAALKSNRLISEAIVIGDRRKFLSALITLDEEAVAQFVEEKGLKPGPVDQIPELRAAVQESVDDVNSRLARVEWVRKFTILRHAFSIANGELTPTLKVKRNVVNELYKNQIDAMYAEERA